MMLMHRFTLVKLGEKEKIIISERHYHYEE
jgi:hypothetical protein